jgi:hypothetical protein
MANELYRKNLIPEIRSAISKALGIKEIDHSALVGTIREILIEKLLEPVLSPDVKFGKGKIIDAYGNLSSEIDIIVYYPKILPPILYDSKTGVFPLESCLYSIEVKSILSSSTLKDSIEKAKKLDSLIPLPGNARSISLKVCPVLFAFKSDLRSNAELDRHIEQDKNLNTKPFLSAFCVVGSGYWYHNSQTNSWYFCEPTDDYDEVISFLGGVANSIPGFISAKEIDRPAFGNYLIKENAIKPVK